MRGAIGSRKQQKQQHQWWPHDSGTGRCKRMGLSVRGPPCPAVLYSLLLMHAKPTHLWSWKARLLTSEVPCVSPQPGQRSPALQELSSADSCVPAWFWNYWSPRASSQVLATPLAQSHAPYTWTEPPILTTPHLSALAVPTQPELLTYTMAMPLKLSHTLPLRNTSRQGRSALC